MNDHLEMHTKEIGGRESAGAKRLRLIRIAEGETNSSRWAKRLGWTLPQLSNYENGVTISRNAAIQMANRIDGLTTDQKRRLEEAEAAEQSGEAAQSNR